jgi:hypothetical protein
LSVRGGGVRGGERGGFIFDSVDTLYYAFNSVKGGAGEDGVDDEEALTVAGVVSMDWFGSCEWGISPYPLITQGGVLLCKGF